jgi:type IV pilus assembly protein PilB
VDQTEVSSTENSPGEAVTLSYRTKDRRHWLVDVAEHAGLRDLSLRAGAPFQQIRAAWAEIARAAGISEEALAERVAQHFRLAVADLGAVEPQTAKLLPEETARKHGVLPLQASDQLLVVATSDPVSMEAEQAIQFLSGRQPVFQVAAPGRLLEAIERAYSREKIVDFVLQTLAAEAAGDDVRIVREASASVEAIEGRKPAQSIANLVHRVLRQAIRSKASGISIGRSGESGQVQLRVDGVSEHFMHLPTPALVRVVRRVKELARIDPDGRGPREGRFRVTVDGDTYRVRVQAEPVGSVDRLDIRITRPDAHPSLESLQLTEGDTKALQSLCGTNGGLILVAVPEGAGRSRVLTALAQTLGSQGRRVTCLETSADYDLEGTKTVQVDPEQGFGFAEALARALDEGPDVVVMSELDEASAAALAMDAAEHGTLILALCRGEDAIAGIARLTALGVDRGRIATSLRAVVAERLLRSICSACGRQVVAPDDIPSAERTLAEAYAVRPPRVPVGCGECRGTGFHGRIPILEIIPITGRFPELIRGGALLSDLKNEARSTGVRDLRDGGIARVTAGATSVREVERVLGPSLSNDGASAPGTVLIIDDTAADRLLMRTLLEQHGFEVHQASSGMAGLETLGKTAGISLVLLDLLMPGIDGRETLRRIRMSIRTAGIPVIILTASDDPKLELQLLEAGADDYLGKPFDPARLIARVRAVMRRVSGTPETGSVARR